MAAHPVASVSSRPTAIRPSDRTMPRPLTILLTLAATALTIGAGATVDDGNDAGPQPIEAPGIENLYRLSPSLFSGGQPEGAEAFQALADLGVRTIVTVDGAAPDVELARQYGLRYVHLPVGYDGIPRDQAMALVRVAKSLPGPLYVHCHHGKHRGPSAAAVCAIATEGWDHSQARSWLEAAGTSPDYAGLFASVDAFEPPTEAELDTVPEKSLTERARVPDLVEAMVAVDIRWESLKAIANEGFKVPRDHPDLDPMHEALMLAEQYRELQRLDEAKGRGEPFLALLKGAETHAQGLREALRPDPDRTLSQRKTAFDLASNDCKTCHKQYRDHLP